MKNGKIILAAAMLAAASLQSCLKDDGPSYSELVPNAVVTVKPDGDKFYLQLDDSTVIYPTNMSKSPFGEKEVRAFVNYKIESEKDGEQQGFINWMNELLTKQTAVSEGSDDQNTKKYGNDQVELINAFPTVCEDGYLTLRFQTWLGSFSNEKHEVNLLTGVDENDPYTVEFRHNAHGDSPDVLSDGYVAFRLDQLPDTKGKTVTLKVKFNSPRGERTAEFKYRTRPSDSKE